MQTLKFNSQQLSIFDLNKASASRKELREKINKALQLDDDIPVKEMLEACLKKPEIFSINQRQFLRNCIWMEIDSKVPSEKQQDYLYSLYLRS